MVRKNMEIDMERSIQVMAFLADPENFGISHREAARRLGVHESYIRRVKETYSFGTGESLDISKIRLEPCIQIRGQANPAFVNEYAEAWRSGATFPLPVVFHDGVNHWCGDGGHRILGAKAAGKRKVDCDIRMGGRREAILFACGCNERHGYKRGDNDRKRAVEACLADIELAARNNNQEIADICKVDRMFVLRVREDQEKTRNNVTSSDESETQTLKSKNGKTYTRKKPVPKPKPVPSNNGTSDSASSPSASASDQPESSDPESFEPDEPSTPEPEPQPDPVAEVFRIIKRFQGESLETLIRLLQEHLECQRQSSTKPQPSN